MIRVARPDQTTQLLSPKIGLLRVQGLYHLQKMVWIVLLGLCTACSAKESPLTAITIQATRPTHGGVCAYDAYACGVCVLLCLCVCLCACLCELGNRAVCVRVEGMGQKVTHRD